MCIYDVYAPCSCPHGRCFTVLAQCFTIASWVCSIVAVTSCMYIYVRPIPEEGEPEYPREGFGYISRQQKVKEAPDYGQCVFWQAEEKQLYFDDMFRAGKAMSLMAVGIGTIVMLVIMCTCCVAFQLRTFEGLFWTSMLCFVAQMLTFLAWGSDLCDNYECTWAGGTGMNITAAMLWVWAANMIKSFPEALPPRGRGRRKPIYDDEDNDDPYANGPYDDDYDYDADEGEFENDNEYYDDYDENGYGDRDRDNYEDQEGYEDQDYDDDDGRYGGNKYDDDDQEASPYEDRRRRQDNDDEYDDSGDYFENTTDDQSRFSKSQDPNSRKQEDLGDSQSSFRGID